MKNHKKNKSMLNANIESKHNKRWKKGQSCASNPSFNKFRQQAKKNKNSVYVSDSKKSNLTIDALQKHEALNVDRDFSIDFDTGTYLSDKTGASYMSVCTNASFSKIVNRFAMSNSAAHKEVLIILEAVAELIKENEEVDTDTDYFAALLLLLKTGKFENDIQLNAIMFLLTISVKRLPNAVLRAKFSETSLLISNILNEKIESELQSLVRSAVLILAHLLRCQDYSSWSLESTKHIYYSILCLVDSSRPKIRKAAHQSVGMVLRSSFFMLGTNPPLNHPAANQTAKYCIKKLEKQSNTTLFILGLLSDVMAVFTSTDLKLTCESILKLMTLSDSIMKTVCMTTLRKMFGMRPIESILSAQLNAQIISALFEYRPSDEDSQMAEQWMVLMQKAFSNLSRLDAILFLNHLPRLFETCLKFLQTHPQVSDTVVTIFKAILNDCNEEIKTKATLFSQENNSCLHKLLRKLEHSLGYQFVSVWDTIITIYTYFIEVFGKVCPSLFNQSLVLISTIRETQNFSNVALIDRLVGLAVKNLGPQLVLAALPLNITGNNDDLSLYRSWLLPVMRDNVQQTQLAFYVDFFLPLALNIQRKCNSLKDSSHQIEFKTYNILQNQIWSLLPGFCTLPTDLIQSFPKIAQLLGRLIQNNNDVRLDILNSIRKLINLNFDKVGEKEILARFAKNFIPIFCNLYTLTISIEEEEANGNVKMTKTLKSNESRSLPKASSLSVLETFKCYLRIADQTVVETCIQTCLKKLFVDEVSILQKYLLMDLVISMLEYISLEHLNTVYTFALSNLQVTDKTMQKKCYRILERICKSDSDAMKQLMKSSINDIISKLILNLVTSNPTSKGPRLKCLMNIIKYNEHLDENLISTIIPEVVICTKAVGERTRVAAYGLLIEIAKAYIRCNPLILKQESLMKFVILLLPGLTINNMTMVACTILSITKVIFDLKECVNDDLLKMLVESVCILLKSRSREVVETALGFIKCLITSFSKSFDQFLKPVISSFVCMKEENHHHFRFRTKEIYSRLIRKYGHSILLEMIPESQHRWINNMRKEIERNKKKKLLKKNERGNSDEAMSQTKSQNMMSSNEISSLLQDSDSSFEMDKMSKKSISHKSSKTNKSQRNQLRKENKAILYEEDDEPIDFLDPSASQKVLASKPNKLEKVKSDEFEISSDGRIIIPTETEKKKIKLKKEAIIDEAVDLVDRLSLNKRKRKKSDIDEEDDEINDDNVSRMSYKSGGKGIHRSIPKKKMQPGQEFKAKRAEGDVKKGKIEPYAYFPLDFGSLNKRKKAKSSGQFRNIIKGAKKGALKGSKLKNKQHKKH